MRNERHGFSIICQTKITELGDLSNTNKKNLVASKCWILTRKIWTNTGQYPLLSPPVYESVYESGGMRCAGHLVEFHSKIKQSLDRFKSSLTWLLFTPLVIEHGQKKKQISGDFPMDFPISFPFRNRWFSRWMIHPQVTETPHFQTLKFNSPNDENHSS